MMSAHPWYPLDDVSLLEMLCHWCSPTSLMTSSSLLSATSSNTLYLTRYGLYGWYTAWSRRSKLVHSAKLSEIRVQCESQNPTKFVHSAKLSEIRAQCASQKPSLINITLSILPNIEISAYFTSQNPTKFNCNNFVSSQKLSPWYNPTGWRGVKTKLFSKTLWNISTIHKLNPPQAWVTKPCPFCQSDRNTYIQIIPI